MTDHPVQIPEMPSEDTMDRLVSLLEPFRRVTQPRFYGIENIPGLYFWFGDPIDTARFTGRSDDTAARPIRDETKRAILAGIQLLRDERDNDPHRAPVKRLLRRLQ